MNLFLGVLFSCFATKKQLFAFKTGHIADREQWYDLKHSYLKLGRYYKGGTLGGCPPPCQKFYI